MSTDLLARILNGLNSEQLAAATAPPQGQLQVVAGPGTGKTSVLTARVAYLLVHYGLRPWELIVTTFTRKAALEMKQRLRALLEGSGVAYEKLFIGTMHSVSMRLLRRYGSEIGLTDKFYVANNTDTADVLDGFLEEIKDELDTLRTQDEEKNDAKDLRNDKDVHSVNKIKRQISHLKSQGFTTESYAKLPTHSKELLKIYQEMSNRMQKMNMLDFDDILLYTIQLLSERTCITTIKHILVDEFQDTNSVQLTLIKLLAGQSKYHKDNITVVGDLDQSIYAFRGADPRNFATLTKMYPGTKLVKLKENYRSTQSVLDSSEHFMRQQQNRPTKQLHSQHSITFPVVHQQLGSEYKEAEYIAEEIKFLRSLPGLYDSKDVAVLVRANYMTRVIENALSSKKLAYSVLKGRAFWERKEVMMVLDMLKCVSRPADRCALVRTLVNVGAGVGDVSARKITTLMEEKFEVGMTPLHVLRMIAEGTLQFKGLSVKVKESCEKCVQIIDDTTMIYNDEKMERNDVVELFDYFLQTETIQSLITEDSDKKENLEELRRQLEVFVPEEEDVKVQDDADVVDLTDASEMTFLENFLNSVDIYTPEEVTQDSQGEDRTTEEDKITLSTIHSAKGLEWPVVFVVGLNEGQFPSGRTDDIMPNVEENENEDRRVFYVATTRAKHLLYITSSSNTSKFLAPLIKDKKLTDRQRALSKPASLTDLYTLHDKLPPPAEQLQRHITEYTLLRASSENDTHNTGFKTAIRKTYAPSPMPHVIQYAPRPAATLSKPMIPLRARVMNSVVKSKEEVKKARAPMGSVNSEAVNPVKRKKTLGVRRRRM